MIVIKMHPDPHTYGRNALRACAGPCVFHGRSVWTSMATCGACGRPMPRLVAAASSTRDRRSS